MKLIVTGGAGFIGSAFVRLLLADEASGPVTVVDALTYAGNLDNLTPVAGDARYRFVKANITDAPKIGELVAAERPDAIVHFAAESHVDRSILSPEVVVPTNFFGTLSLLEAARKNGVSRFLHASTDEVYGSVPDPH